MIVLGLAGGLGHDASAALVIDGELMSIAEEERFTRVRHAPDHLPVEGAARCLAAAGLEMSDVDVLATSWIDADRDQVNRDMQETIFLHPYFADSRRPRWERVKHPLAHAAASYFTSGLDEATIICIDGVGDGVATSVYHGRNGTIEVKREYDICDSLGMFYLGMTHYLGFRFGQEGKVMGLAAYAYPDLDWMPFSLDDDGGYRSGLDVADADRPDYGGPVHRAWTGRFAEHFGTAPPHASYTYNSATARLDSSLEPNRWRQHVAASGQGVLDRVLVHIVEDAVRETGCRNVVLGGGVGYNCTANGALWRSGAVDHLYIFPASGDAGTSAGAALQVAAAGGEHHVQPLRTAALGAGFTADQIHVAVQERGVAFTLEDDIAGAVADLLVEGKIVGWFQGRAEVGPRALGQRSILASPLRRSMHERVNTIKSREQWRPLAPSMSAEAAKKYLVNPGPVDFMLSAVQVEDSGQSEIPAVVHVDGSCRPQVVRDDEGLYRSLLRGVADRGHPEVVMNTSFNLANEPIVNCPADALSSFYSSGLDALAIGSILIVK